MLWKSALIAVLFSFVIAEVLATGGNSVVRSSPLKGGRFRLRVEDPDGIKRVEIFDSNGNWRKTLIPGTNCPREEGWLRIKAERDRYPLKVAVYDCQRDHAVDWWKVKTTGETEGPYKDSDFQQPYDTPKKYPPLAVGGIAIPADKFALLAPYIALTWQ
jgi:hypothetical protein